MKINTDENRERRTIGSITTIGRKTYAVPPLEIIKEYMEFRNVSEVDLENKLGKDRADRLLKNEIAIDDELAYDLGELFDVSPLMFMHLERRYREELGL